MADARACTIEPLPLDVRQLIEDVSQGNQRESSENQKHEKRQPVGVNGMGRLRKVRRDCGTNLMLSDKDQQNPHHRQPLQR